MLSGGASDINFANQSSFIPLSERLSKQMECWSSPANAVMKLDLPQPGGP